MLLGAVFMECSLLGELASEPGDSRVGPLQPFPLGGQLPSGQGPVSLGVRELSSHAGRRSLGILVGSGPGR